VTEVEHSAEKDATIAGHFCGQSQPHGAHEWHTPPVYGSTAIISTYQCAGLAAGGRGPGCLPFCQGGLHEEDCPNLARVIPPERTEL